MEPKTGVYAQHLTEDGGFIDEVRLGDAVELCGMRGTVAFEAGAFGVAVEDGVDWDALDARCKETCPGSPCLACRHNDIDSLWEMLSNLGDVDTIYDLHIIDRKGV